MIESQQEQVILILDFGSQTAQLIARRVREAGVFSVLVDPELPASEIANLNPKGIILSGSPANVYDRKAPLPDFRVFEAGVPVLGICYGLQLISHFFKGSLPMVCLANALSLRPNRPYA